MQMQKYMQHSINLSLLLNSNLSVYKCIFDRVIVQFDDNFNQPCKNLINVGLTNLILYHILMALN